MGSSHRLHLYTGWRRLQHAAGQLALALLSWQASSALLRMGAVWWYSMSAVQAARRL
jgi:hypothetical protein